MANTGLIQNKYKIDIVKFRYFWLTFTSIILIPCIAAIIYLMATQPNHAPLKLGIDFTGGTILQYNIQDKISTSDLSKARVNLEAIGIKNPVIQNTTETKDGKPNNLLSIRTTFLSDKDSKDKINEVTEILNKDFGNTELLAVNSVGPTLGKELQEIQ